MKKIFTIAFSSIVLFGCDFEYPNNPYHLVDYYPITRTSANGKILQVDPRDFDGIGQAGQTCMEALLNRKDRSKSALAPVYPNPLPTDQIKIFIPFEVHGEPYQLMIFDNEGSLVKTILLGTGWGTTSWQVQSSPFINDRVKKGYYEIVLKAGNRTIRGDIYVF